MKDRLRDISVIGSVIFFMVVIQQKKILKNILESMDCQFTRVML